MFKVGLFFFVPFLSLAIVLVALSLMAPQHKFSLLWRTACLIAALPPLLMIAGFLLSSNEGLVLGVVFLSFVVSAPLAAALSLAVAVRLRKAA
jgi:hypothetical protein